MASRVTSRHHWKAQRRVQGIVRSREYSSLWNQQIVQIRLLKSLREVIKGQGLGVTRWNG